MQRAVGLARRAEGVSLPNPMVGCVIVAPGDRIIGQGFTDVCGKGHAEVQAVASVKPEHLTLLPESTAYVTLEPCSHYGRTPPCALLLAEKRLNRVVVGCVDPNPKVSGRGIEMLRQAGVQVDMADPDLQRECAEVNRKFFYTQLTGLPWVTLKWAQSSDGYMDRLRQPSEPAVRFSTALSSVQVHRLRARHDAILVGSGTVLMDSPRLDVRLSGGFAPRPVILDRRGRIDPSALRLSRDPLIVSDCDSVEQLLRHLRAQGITSVLVEGGAKVLRSFVDSGLWCAARVEIAHLTLGSDGTAQAPELPCKPVSAEYIGQNLVLNYLNQAADGANRVKNT